MIQGRVSKKVLLTCAIDSGVGGLQVVLRDLAASLEQNGWEVGFIYPVRLPKLALTDSIDERNRRIVRCPMPAVVKNNMLLSAVAFLVWFPIIVPQLTRLFRRDHINAIHCHYLSPYFIYLVIAARLTRIPAVVSVHGADVENLEASSFAHRLACRMVMQSASCIVACSQALARQTADLFPNVVSKITYVHNALDLSHYPSPGTTRELPTSYLLCVSRHVRKKGIDTLLRAFALLTRDFPELRLLMVGSGPLLGEHTSLARSLGIEARVEFVGDVEHEEVAQFFAGCTVFVLPSRLEPFGLVLLEAARYSKPIVCTRVGGVPEIVKDGVNGLLVDSDDPTAMANAISSVLRDTDLAHRLGKTAHRVLLERFLWKDRIREYIEIYERSVPSVSQRLLASGPSSRCLDVTASPGSRKRHS